MNYLFFDTECANCFNGAGKLCEFGYVLLDQNYNIIEQDNLIINPQSDFDWYVAKKIITYPKEVYLQSPNYDFYFDKINALLTLKDTMVIGHSLDNDVKYIIDEAKRYKLPFTNFEFYDFKIAYSKHANVTSGLKLESICSQLEINVDNNLHRALTDAMLTMRATIKICNLNNVSVENFFALYKESKGNCVKGKFKSYPQSYPQKP